MDPAQRPKYSAAQAFEASLRQLGYTVMLGGGAGATSLGGPRPVKDLDFKMGSKLKQDWANDERRMEVIQGVRKAMEGYGYSWDTDNTGSRKQLKYVLRLTLGDKLTGDLKVRQYGPNAKEVRRVVGQEKVEISLTTSGAYDEAARWSSPVAPALVMHPVDPTQLALDKVFVLAQRNLNETAKMRTDFEDLAALVARHDITVRKELLEIRKQGFMKASRRATPNSDQSVTDVVRSRISLIRKDLGKPPGSSGREDRVSRESKDDSRLPAADSPLKDERLRESQVKTMITRVGEFLTDLDDELELVT